MKTIVKSILILGLLAGTRICASDYQVTFETITCDGETGYGTVTIEK